MRRFAAALIASLGLLALTGCHTAKPAVQTFHDVSYVVPAPPADVIAQLRAGAHGNGVMMDGPNSLRVDFGQATHRVPVPTEYGLWGTRVSFRDTLVRSSAIYHVEATADGRSIVTMVNNPVYWHPDHGTWLDETQFAALADFICRGGDLLASEVGKVRERITNRAPKTGRTLLDRFLGNS